MCVSYIHHDPSFWSNWNLWQFQFRHVPTKNPFVPIETHVTKLNFVAEVDWTPAALTK